jgi:membrane protease YdiL (CAAX protease family)
VDSPSELPSPPGPPPPPAPPRAPGRPLGFFVALAILYVGPGAASQLIFPAAGLAWTQLFAFLLPAAIFAAGWNLLPARALRVDRPPPPGTVALGAIVGAVAFVAAGATMALVSTVLPRSWVKAFDLAPLFQAPGLERVALAATATFLAPICEEAAFRGHLLSLLRARLPPAGAIAVTALAFAALHLDPVRFVAVFELGVLYGWLAWRAGSLWPAIAAHAANNGVATALVWAAGRASSSAATHEPRPLAALATLGLALIPLTALLAHYRRLTPEPPQPEEALLPADPADPDPRFRLRRVQTALRWLAALGVALLPAIVLLRRLR